MAKMRLYTALEDLDTTITASDPVRDELVMRDHLDDINESADRLDSLTDTIDDASDDLDTLNGINATIDNNAIVTESLIIAIESIYNRLGIEHISLESNSNKDIKISLEGIIKDTGNKIKEGLKKAWEFLVNLFNKVMKAIKDFFAPKAKEQKKRAEDLKVNDINDVPEPVKEELKEHFDLKDHNTFSNCRIYNLIIDFNDENDRILTAKEIIKRINRLEYANNFLTDQKDEDMRMVQQNNMRYSLASRSQYKDCLVECPTKNELINVLNLIVKIQNDLIPNCKKEIDKLKNEINEANDKMDSEELEKIKRELKNTKIYMKIVTRISSALFSYSSKSIEILEKAGEIKIEKHEKYV